MTYRTKPERVKFYSDVISLLYGIEMDYITTEGNQVIIVPALGIELYLREHEIGIKTVKYIANGYEYINTTYSLRGMYTYEEVLSKIAEIVLDKYGKFLETL